MLRSSTDYVKYPTVTRLSRNDKNTLYLKSITGQEIRDLISRVSSLEQENRRLSKQMRNASSDDIKRIESKMNDQERQRADENKKLNKKIEQLSSDHDFFYAEIEQLMKDNKELMIELEKLKKYSSANTQKSKKQQFQLKKGDHYTMGTYANEPIEWRVLDVQNDKALLISERGLDVRSYHNLNTSITWVDCELRNWLNQAFYNASFINAEKEKILESDVKNKYNPQYGTRGGADTQDRIFMLSLDEVQQYFNNDDDRICYPTVYAIRQGAFLYENKTCWWLRSPGRSSLEVAYINANGTVNMQGKDAKRDNYSYSFDPFANRGGGIGFCVRPAMWIRL